MTDPEQRQGSDEIAPANVRGLAARLRDMEQAFREEAGDVPSDGYMAEVCHRAAAALDALLLEVQYLGALHSFGEVTTNDV